MERIDDLGINNFKLIQDTDSFCFGIDSVLLSDFAKQDIKTNSKVLDLGTGNGIISILLCAKTKLSEIIGVEIQKNSADLASRNSKLNNLEDKFKILNCDLKNIENFICNNSIDSIVTNPPYKPLSTGKTNDNEAKLIARHEIKCNLEDIITVSSKMLKNSGSFFMVHKSERLADIVFLLKKYKLEPKKIRFIYPNINKESNLVLIKSVKGGKPFLKIDSPLYVYNPDGSYTNEILKIYGKE